MIELDELDRKWLAGLNRELDRATQARVSFVRYLFTRYAITDGYGFDLEKSAFVLKEGVPSQTA